MRRAPFPRLSSLGSIPEFLELNDIHQIAQNAPASSYATARSNDIAFKFRTLLAGSNLLENVVSQSSELSQNLNSEELFQSKTINLLKWTTWKLRSADYSFNFSAFYLNW